MTAPDKTRLTTALDRDARALLDELTDSPGEFLSTIIRQHYTDIREALAVVDGYGWRRGEVLAVCDAANGLWLLPGTPAMLALELEDGARLAGILRHGASPDRWPARIAEVDAHADLAAALLVVARSWWTGAALVTRWIDRLPAD